MITLCALTKNPAIHHQQCSNFRNQSQKRFQKFHQIKVFLTKKKSGYNVSLKYTPTQNQAENKQQMEQRKQNIIWFNPPYFLNVKTNVGKLFPKLLDLHFPSVHKFHKIFNCNTVKINYFSMKNMGSIISSHNNPVTIIDATVEKKKAVHQTANALCPTSFMKLKLLTTLMMSMYVKCTELS